MVIADETAFKQGIKQSLQFQPTSTSTSNLSIDGYTSTSTSTPPKVASAEYKSNDTTTATTTSTTTNFNNNNLLSTTTADNNTIYYNKKKDKTTNATIKKTLSTQTFSNTAIANDSNYKQQQSQQYPQQQQYIDTTDTISIRHMPECTSKMITSNNSMYTLCSESTPATTPREKLPNRSLLKRTSPLFPGQVVHFADEEEREKERGYSSAASIAAVVEV